VLDLSPTKLIIIFVVAVVLLGPKRLPQVARQLGAGWRRVRDLTRQIDQEVRQSIPDLPSSQEIVRFARSPVTLLNRLADLPVESRDALVADPGAPAADGSDPGGPTADPAAGVPAQATQSNGARAGVPWPEDTGVVSGPPATGAISGTGAGGVGADGVGSRQTAPARGPVWDPGAGGLSADDPSLN
jgi:sec-independent protein translocase protein TatB